MIEARDRALFRLFLLFRLATRAQLFALLADSFTPRTLPRRLLALSRAGYLARPPEQELRIYEKRGGQEKVYALGNRGARELASEGLELPKIDWDQKARGLKSYSLAHPLLTTQIVATFLIGLRRHPELDLIDVLPDGKFHTHVTVFDGKRELSLPIKPDSVLLIDEHDGRGPVAFFIEADRDTMPRRRGDFEQSSFLKKARAYFAYRHEKRRLRDELGVANFVVLTVAQTPASAGALRTIATRVDPEQRGTDIFWFTHVGELPLPDPERPLFAAIWTTAAGETGALF